VFFCFCFCFLFCGYLLGLHKDLLGLCGGGASCCRGRSHRPLGGSVEDAHEALARVLRHCVIHERLELLRAIDVDGAHAVEAREGAARRDIHEEPRGETAEGTPGVRVALAVGDPVVVLDILREVAELLWRRVGEAWHGAEALAEAVVVVVAAHVIDLVVVLRGLVAGEGRGRARIDALLAAVEAICGGCRARDARADPREDSALELLCAGLAHGEDAHLAVEHDCNRLHARHIWCCGSGLGNSSTRHKLGSIRIQSERHFVERRDGVKELKEAGEQLTCRVIGASIFFFCQGHF
jgi:hypothetical protein